MERFYKELESVGFKKIETKLLKSLYKKDYGEFTLRIEQTNKDIVEFHFSIKNGGFVQTMFVERVRKLVGLMDVEDIINIADSGRIGRMIINGLIKE